MKKISHYNKKEQLALATFVKLMRAADSFSSRTHHHLADEGLTMSQFQVLEVLYHVGPLCQRDIAQKILKTTGNLTMVINNLEKNKLVKRKKDNKDKRFYSVELSKQGEKLMTELFPKHLGILVDEISILSAEEQEKLGELSKKIGLKE